VEQCKLPSLELSEYPAANDFVHVRDTETMLLAIKELQMLVKQVINVI